MAAQYKAIELLKNNIEWALIGARFPLLLLVDLPLLSILNPLSKTSKGFK